MYKKYSEFRQGLFTGLVETNSTETKLKHRNAAIAAGLVLVGDSDKKDYGKYLMLCCGSIQDLKPCHVAIGNFRCKNCQENKIKQEAVSAGVELVGKVPNDAHKRLYKMQCCGEIQDMQVAEVRKGSFRCRNCANIKLKEEAQLIGLDLLGKAHNGLVHYRRYKLACCGIEKDVHIGSVRKGGVFCESCQEDKLNKEAFDNGVTLIGKTYDSKYRKYRMNCCGHEQEMQTGSVRNGTFVCRNCGESDYQKKSNIYLLKITLNNFSWLKLGTAGNVRIRTTTYGLPKNAQIETLVVVPTKSGFAALKKERKIHKRFLDNRLNPLEMRKFHSLSGFTECYPVEIVGSIIKELEELGEFSNG